MTEVLRIEAGELSADEIIDALNDGRRILVDVEVAGGRGSATTGRRTTATRRRTSTATRTKPRCAAASTGWGTPTPSGLPTPTPARDDDF